MPGPIFIWLKGYEGAVFVERVLMEGESGRINLRV